MRLTVIDPSLRDRAGHNFDYARLVGADAIAAGFEVRAVAHAQCDIGQEAIGFMLLPWFSLGLKDNVQPTTTAGLRRVLPAGIVRAIGAARRRLAPPDNDERALASRARRFAEQLSGALGRLALGPGDRLFFPTLSWADAAEAARISVKTPLKAAETLITLRFDPPQASWAREQLYAAARAADERICWLADTQPLAEAYQKILQRRVIVAPIPIDTAALHAAADQRPRAPPVRVLFLGESRVEKGAVLLPAIVKTVLDRADAPDISFTIQLLTNIRGGERGILEAFSALAALEGPRVELLRGDLDSDQFHRTLGGGHILLAPYSPGAYRLRSSGLVVQALAAGLAVVAPAAPSWISRTLKQEDAADFAYDDGPEAAASAILRAAAAARLQSRAPRIPQVAQGVAPWAVRSTS